MSRTVTLVWSFLGGHGGYLAVALLTHGLVGYALGAWLFDEPRAGLVGGLLADVDLLFPAAWGAPFVHRGITHTPFAAAVTVAVVAGVAVALTSRNGLRIAGGVGVGYASQLLIDTTTPKGILPAYPLSTESVAVPLGGHSPLATIAIWLGCAAILWREYSRE